ncbi:condensation domain-containing protein [Streptomyces cyaneofuscatus]|uniref:condensation domain-containing protein n=1 Tax=Streptomyces cyaneofuscatus TaxID=66883 RepID=UPI0033ADECC9
MTDRTSNATRGGWAGPAAAAVQAPLAPTQRRMWLLEQLVPGRVEYNVVDCWALTGPVNVPSLEAAVQDVMQRHDALRATFHLEGDIPVQRFHPTGAAGLEVVAGVLDEATALERAETLARTPFSLTSAPLVRWILIPTGEERHLLQLVAHHLVVDGWSLELLVEDLSTCYEERMRGVVPGLLDAEVPYQAYACRDSDAEALHEQTEYWKEALRDLPPPPGLPAAAREVAARPVRQSLPVEAELVDRIKRLARAEGVTPSAVWLTCFAAVLGRWGGSRDVVVGSPLSGRTSADLLRTVGFFIATVALRVDFTEGATGREMLARAHRVLIDAQLNQDVPFDEVVAAVRPQRQTDAALPFSAWFNMLSYPTHALRLGMARGERLPAPLPGSPFGLSFYVDQRQKEAVRLDLVHDTGQLERPYARALLSQVLSLARVLADDLDVRIDAVALGRKDTTPRPIASGRVRSEEGMAERLRRHPVDDIAVVDDEGEWTYGDLRLAAAALAERLRAAGLAPGELVEIEEARGRRLPAALLAVWDCGGVFLVTDPSHPAPWRAKLRAQARPRYRLTWTGDDATLEEADPAAVPPSERVHGGGLHGLGRPLYLLPTSGTTRGSRLVLGCEDPLLAYLDWWSRRYRIGSHDRFCATSGLSHDPLLRDLLLPLWNGAVLTIPPPGHRLAPARVAAWLAAHSVSVLHVTPLVGRLIAQAARGGGTPLHHVRLVCFGGDVLTAGTITEWRQTAPGAQIVSVYGTTETPQAASCFDVPPGELPAETPLGHGAVEARLDVVTKTGAPAGCGEVGEIVVRSPLLTMGYVGDDAATRAAYRRDPWGDPAQAVFRTGDIGRRLWDGSVSFVGREGTVVKTRGHRVSLIQLAGELCALPGVRDAVVIQRDAVASGTRLIAYVVRDQGVSMGPEDTLRALAQTVPSGYLPDDVCLLDALPVTPNGKLDAARLPAPGTQVRPVPERRPAAARGVTERALAAVWEDVLGLPRIAVDDNFFDLGGTSITAVQLRTRLESRLNRSLPPLLVFQCSTVRRMAAWLSGSPTAADGRPPETPSGHGSTRELRRAARAALTSEGGKR